MDEILVLAHSIVRGAWRNRWHAVAIAWVVCIGGWIGVMRLPPHYQSNAQLYVAADPVLTPLLHGLAINGDSQEEFQLLQRTLLSDPNLSALLDKTGLGLTVEGPGAREALIRKLRSKVEIDPQTDHLFTIRYDSPSPKRAYEVVQGLVNIYVERATVHNQGDMNNARVFLDSQIDYFHSQLETLEARRAQFQAKYLQLLPGANGVSALERARSQLRDLQGQLEDSVAARNIVRQQLDKTKPLLTGAAAVASGGSAALQAAEAHLAELKQQYTDAYPGVIAAKRQVDALRHSGGGSTSVSGVGRAVANPVYENLHLQLLNLETKIFSLRRQIKATNQQETALDTLARSQPGIEAKYINLNRNYSTLQTEYHDLIQRREAMRIGAAANVDANQIQLQIVNPPQVPRLPVGPNRPLLLAVVLVLGVGAGVSIAAVLAQMEGSFETIDDLRKLGLPVIGGVSDLRPRRNVAGAIIRVGGAAVLLFLVFGGFMIGSVLMLRFA